MRKPSKRYLVGAIAFTTSLLAAGCSGEATTTATENTLEDIEASVPTESTPSSESTDETLPFTEEFTIGLSARDLSDGYSKQVARGVEAKARELSADIVVVSADSDPQKQLADIQALVDDGVDGIIIEPVDPLEAVKATDIASDSDVPVLAVTDQIGDSGQLGEKFVFPGTNGLVSTDDREIGGTAAEIIKQQAFETLNIAVLAGPETHDRYQLRLDGFVSTLERSTKPFEITQSFGDDTAAQGTLDCADINERDASTNIIFAVTDKLAQGCVEAYIAAGLDPAELPAIVSVGGGAAAKTMLEQNQIVASICIQPREIGEIASNQLMNTMLTGNQARSPELVPATSVSNADDSSCPFKS